MDTSSINIFNVKSREFGFALFVVFVVFAVSFYQLKLGEMKTRDSRRRDDTEVVARGLRAYYKEHGAYPESNGGKIVACGSDGIDVCVWGNDTIVDADSVVYVQNLPQEPLSDQGYSYIYEVNQERTKFRVYARLEYTKDPVVKPNQSVVCGPNTPCNWYVEN